MAFLPHRARDTTPVSSARTVSEYPSIGVTSGLEPAMVPRFPARSAEQLQAVFRVLAIVHDVTRECLKLPADVSLSGLGTGANAIAQRSGFGASRPLPCVPTKVPSPFRLRTSINANRWSSRPTPWQAA
jgi:hypothetical protein